MKKLTLEERIRGTLLGAAMGAELGFARTAEPQRFEVKEPKGIFALKLAPAEGYKAEPNRVWNAKITPFIDLGVRTYLTKKGRVTPEDFAEQLKRDEAIAGPVFSWDGVHTIQEILREGMNPRISGLGNPPCGLIAAAMPAVGIYHFADPEYAYLDGVELASVAQPRLGADWAALCAAAIACALAPNSSPDGVIETVLKLAHENSKELFYQLNGPTRAAGWAPSGSDEEFARWWQTAGRIDGRRETNWVAFNPIASVLPLLKRCAAKPEKFMALLLTQPINSWYITQAGYNTVPAVIGGALLGALGGPEVFPKGWRSWAEPIAEPWFPIAKVVKTRVVKERSIVAVAERLTRKKGRGESPLFDKVYGCILAGAIGNAMGSPVECRMYWEIDKQYPGGITTVLRPERLEGEDDNQMAMKLVETYLGRGGLPVLARHFGQTWREHLNRDHFYTMCMGHAYDLICQGWDPRISGHWSVVTGSTVMCMEPVGVYHFADPEFAAIDATAISYMYQRGLDMVAATMLAATVAEALRPRATVESVCQAALDAAPKGKMHTFDRRKFKSAYEYIGTCLDVADKYSDVLKARAELYRKCLMYHMIDPLELWGFALAMFKVARGDVRQAAIGGTNIGRDSDTIAGRAAMLAGTLKGAASVPKEWIALFKPDVLARIRRNAARLTELVGVKRVARLQARQKAASEL